jgi:hypothetical protein
MIIMPNLRWQTFRYWAIRTTYVQYGMGSNPGRELVKVCTDFNLSNKLLPFIYICGRGSVSWTKHMLILQSSYRMLSMEYIQAERWEKGIKNLYVKYGERPLPEQQRFHVREHSRL